MLLDGEVMHLRCVARTTKRRRCRLPVEISQNTGWSYLMRPGEPSSLLGLYDLGRVTNADEVQRWQHQHCERHHALDGVTDMVAVEWSPFDPAGYVWADREPGGWNASSEPVHAKRVSL